MSVLSRYPAAFTSSCMALISVYELKEMFDRGEAPLVVYVLSDVVRNQASLREMALGVDESIIDFASGLGQFTRAMARAVPRGRVVGIERSEEQLAEAQRLAAADNEASLVEFRRGDVLNLEL